MASPPPCFGPWGQTADQQRTNEPENQKSNEPADQQTNKPTPERALGAKLDQLGTKMWPSADGVADSNADDDDDDGDDGDDDGDDGR